jgi:hypothetical protein
MCDQMKGLGFIYTETDGQDCSKMIVSNGYKEDLRRFGIKNRIFRDLVHESVYCKSRSIEFFGGSIDILFIRIFFYLNLFNKLDPLLYF